jgi:hypothetical protein
MVSALKNKHELAQPIPDSLFAKEITELGTSVS